MRPRRTKKEYRGPKAWLLAFVALAIALLLLRMWVFVHGKRS
jgi:hypothetical protein